MGEINLQNILPQIFKDKNFVNQVFNWHQAHSFVYNEYLPYIFDELIFHFELEEGIKAEILTNTEFLKTSLIRKQGLEILPKDWMNHQTGEPNNEVLEDLWLRPTIGYLVRILQESTNERDQSKLEKIIQSEAFKYRGVDKTVEERKKARLEKLQISIDQNKIALFLGRQNRIYKKLQGELNQRYADKFSFISDHVWSACGYIERGVKASDNRLSLIQACETILRLPNLKLSGERISERYIMFSLDGYDAKVCLAAIYSNCNRIERNHPKPVIEGIEKFEFAYTGLTDLELANIVRNKYWFDLTKFCRTGGDGVLEELTQEQILKEYGIKYIGERLKKSQ